MTEESANDIAIRIDVESIKVYTKAIIKMFFERYFPEKDTKELQETFNEKYDELLLEHEKNDKTDLSRLYRLITLFKLTTALYLRQLDYNGHLLLMTTCSWSLLRFSQAYSNCGVIIHRYHWAMALYCWSKIMIEIQLPALDLKGS